MRKPWSISTTVRNPERLRDFLRVLQQLEGQEFTPSNQVQYQILLIKEKLYRPTGLTLAQKKIYDSEKPLSFKQAEVIFLQQQYQDPPMRGRQSVNPLNRLGFISLN